MPPKTQTQTAQTAGVSQMPNPPMPANPSPSGPPPPAPAPAGPPTPNGAQGNPAAPAKKVVQGNPNSTQNSLKFAEIRDGLVIMQDGSYRAVILAQSINFDLMSEFEKESVETSFQSFLNSLYFHIQIQIRSYRVDLNTYVERLKKLYEEQDNVLLGMLMSDYIDYIDYLTQTSNIMEKQFFLIIPYSPGQEDLLKKPSAALLKKNKKIVTINESDFEKAKIEMRNRVSAVLQSLNDMNIQSVPLNTQELIELYYNVYNPDTATVQSLASHHELEAELITKGEGQATRSDLGGD